MALKIKKDYAKHLADIVKGIDCEISSDEIRDLFYFLFKFILSNEKREELTAQLDKLKSWNCISDDGYNSVLKLIDYFNALRQGGKK